MLKSRVLKDLITSPDPFFLMEAHSGVSAVIAERQGFSALWGSGLSLSASLGLRDSNEASWSQIVDVVEYMSDATKIPILMDGDSGFGNFNNFRILVKNLEKIKVAGVCIEDKLFPKTNSFLSESNQRLTSIEEFCGKIRAGRDTQSSDDFVIVARTEALIAGQSMQEAIKRAEAYRQAGVDAIVIHSKRKDAREIKEFMFHWGDRLPVIIIPTTYWSTPTNELTASGVSGIIWANHLLRSSIEAMEQVAKQIFNDQSLHHVESAIAPLEKVFSLQDTDELGEAEKRYLP